MADDPLFTFVKDALSRGTPRPVLTEVLGKAGWQPAQIEAALGAFATVDFPIPVPRPRPHVSARDAFIYLVLFSTLYAAATQIGSIAFVLIERAWPDPAAAAWASQAAAVSSRMRWALSALIVSLPVFLFMSARVEREATRDPLARNSSGRKWLTYLTLFLGATVLFCDVMALVYYALGGELTIRFVAKVATVAVIAGCVVGYVWDLRGDEAPHA